MADTKTQVIQTYEGHPTYSCLKCAAVIVRLSLPLTTNSEHCSRINDIGQTLQDELISKAFSGRDGRGL